MTQINDLLPGVGFAGHLSQMWEKRYVLNLNCYCYTTEYMIKSQKQAKSREIIKLSNGLSKSVRIVFKYIHAMVL